MEKKIERNSTILVTGSHRSGSTWVGSILGASREVAYLHEPFNVDRPLSRYFGIENWYQFAARDSSTVDRLACAIAGEVPQFGRLTGGSVRGRLSAVNSLLRLWLSVRAGKRILIKDPLALLSAPSLVDRLGAVAIVVVRHPCAFVSSVIDAGWRHPFDYFLEEKRLVGLLSDRSVLMLEQLKAGRFSSEVSRLAILWLILYEAAWKSLEGEAVFVRHEDLAADPLKEFPKLFQYCSLSFDSAAEALVERLCFGGGADGVHGRHDLKRNSQSVIGKWERKLSSDQIEEIMKTVGPFVTQFY